MKNRKIDCSIRCLDAGTVAAARVGLSSAPVSNVPYVCKISGQREEVFLVSSELARTISDRVPALRDPLDAVLAAATLRARLCECDLAALVREPEAEVLARLEGLEQSGVLTRTLVHGMNYYGIAAGTMRDEI